MTEDPLFANESREKGFFCRYTIVERFIQWLLGVLVKHALHVLQVFFVFVLGHVK